MQGQQPLEVKNAHRVTKSYMDRGRGAVIIVSALVSMLPVDAGGIIAGYTWYLVPKFLLYLGIREVIMTSAVLCLASKAFECAEPSLDLFT